MIASSPMAQISSPQREQGLRPKPLLALRAGRPRLTRRPALTLLEVLIALSIFLLAMVVFGGMVLRNGEIARDVQRQNLATRLCQSKLAEVVAGAVPLTSQGDSAFDEEPDYTWSLTADNGAVDGLWNVTVSVTRRQTDAGAPVKCSLTQMVLDPAVVGSTQDVPVVAGSDASSGAGASSSSSTQTQQSSTGK